MTLETGGQMLRRMVGHDVGGVEFGLAIVMVATAAYCAARLLVPRMRASAAGHHDADLVHVAMALAMAAMLAGVAAPIWTGPGVLVFVVPAVWFGVRSVRSSRAVGVRAEVGDVCAGGAFGHAQLCVASVAMVYMSGLVPGFGSASLLAGEKILSIPGGHQHGGSTAGSTTLVVGVPGVEFALAGAAIVAVLAAFAVVQIAQLSASADRVPGAVTDGVWPRRLAIGCQLAMGATMAHMIAGML